jgi:hypothetical protein
MKTEHMALLAIGAYFLLKPGAAEGLSGGGGGGGMSDTPPTVDITTKKSNTPAPTQTKTSDNIWASLPGPQNASYGGIQSAVTDVLSSIADSLNRQVGANIYLPTANSININPNLPASSLTQAQKTLDAAIIQSGAVQVINPYSQTAGGVGSGLTFNLQQYANYSGGSSGGTAASTNWGVLAAGGTYNPNTGKVTAPTVKTDPPPPPAATLAAISSKLARGLM